MVELGVALLTLRPVESRTDVLVIRLRYVGVSVLALGERVAGGSLDVVLHWRVAVQLDTWTC